MSDLADFFLLWLIGWGPGGIMRGPQPTCAEPNRCKVCNAPDCQFRKASQEEAEWRDEDYDDH